MIGRFSRSRPGPPVTEEPQHERRTPMNEPAPLLPVSELALELPAPSVEGWPSYLAGRGIEITLDDIGRESITRAAARELIIEHSENEAQERERLQQHREAVERQAIERDQQWRAEMPRGIPVGTFPDGVDPIIGQIEAEKASDPRRRQMEEELWGRKFGRPATVDEPEYTYHPIKQEADES